MPGFNPLAWYDFFDVPVPASKDSNPNGPRNREVDIADVLAVLYYAGTNAGGPPNGNGVAYDSVKGSCHVNGHTAPDKEGLCYDRSRDVALARACGPARRGHRHDRCAHGPAPGLRCGL